MCSSFQDISFIYDCMSSSTYRGKYLSSLDTFETKGTYFRADAVESVLTVPACKRCLQCHVSVHRSHVNVNRLLLQCFVNKYIWHFRHLRNGMKLFQ